jgi:hypothetical protein
MHRSFVFVISAYLETLLRKELDMGRTLSIFYAIGAAVCLLLVAAEYPSLNSNSIRLEKELTGSHASFAASYAQVHATVVGQASVAGDKASALSRIKNTIGAIVPASTIGIAYPDLSDGEFYGRLSDLVATTRDQLARGQEQLAKELRVYASRSLTWQDVFIAGFIFMTWLALALGITSILQQAWESLLLAAAPQQLHVRRSITTGYGFALRAECRHGFDQS